MQKLYTVNARYKLHLFIGYVLFFIFSEDVMFEFHPTYDKSDASANSDRPQACLVWLGDEKSRPKYLGQVSPSVL